MKKVAETLTNTVERKKEYLISVTEIHTRNTRKAQKGLQLALSLISILSRYSCIGYTK